MADTNVLLSAIFFPASVPAKALMHAARQHELVLCDYIIAEVFDVVSRKRPDLLPDADVLLAELSYETVIAPRKPSKLIADPKDAPILNSAILENVDIIISGDKHFLRLGIERPKPMTPAQFAELIERDGY
ncbi:MAG: putative toxin-antitoxin system toxin component, PIN family [Clostridiales bacterium]|jgi:putative PIN family toxin of toxin-antitoxin system|nr:putative toxin-antitoxin system toxin component, PIN family [Clostridiales bacterium]